MTAAIRRLGRPLAPAEAAGLAAILAEAFATPEQAWDAEALDALARGGAVVLVLPEGCALIRIAADDAELLTIAVRPGARGRGLGARLLAAAEAEARSLGALRLFLEVAAGNAPARALYARAGYAEAGRRKGYYRRAEGGREDALVLARDLAPHPAPLAGRRDSD